MSCQRLIACKGERIISGLHALLEDLESYCGFKPFFLALFHLIDATPGAAQLTNNGALYLVLNRSRMMSHSLRLALPAVHSRNTCKLWRSPSLCPRYPRGF